MNQRETGMKYEKLACDLIQKQGFLLRECNFRCRQGEIDIIGFHQGYLVFLEVKYRTTIKTGSPEEAVSWAKQKKICRTADYYRFIKGYTENTPVRYDVIAIKKAPFNVEETENFNWYQNAFAHIY